MKTEFTTWIQRITPDVNHISELLMDPLSDEPENLIRDLTGIEAWAGRVGFLLAESNSWLDRAKRFYLPERSEGVTEGDRKSIVDDSVSEIRKTRDILEAMQENIRQRLILGESMLRYYSLFRERTIQKQSMAR